MNAINIVAVLLSPVVAVAVSLWLQNRKELRGQKLYIFNTLIATRHVIVSDEKVRALNMIDVVFFDCTTNPQFLVFPRRNYAVAV